MAISAISMPKWGLAMEEGTIVEWLKAEGEMIAPGDDIVEIETSKITNVVEAQHTGPITRLVAKVGETLPVGALIAVVADESDSAADIDAFISDFQANFETAQETAEEAAGPETIDVDGQLIMYEEQGEGDGLPLILVHGFGGDRNNWLFNLDALSADRRVIMLDLPGHGGSTKNIKDASLSGMAQTVLAFADALGVDQLNLMGHSMGGAICLKAAEMAGERVARVFTVCPAGLAAKVGNGFIDAFIAAERRKGMKEAALMLFSDKDLVTRDLVNDLLKFKRLDGVDAALQALRDGAIADGNATPVDLSEVAARVAAVIAEQDEVIPPVAATPDTVEELRLSVGHMAHMEAAAAVNDAAAAFFKHDR
ncbi:MAG: acetoin dehydrogenase dihydrolipoyllysine-residue acetyltransferase subunit [Pseudomonadota bacterium]